MDMTQKAERVRFVTHKLKRILLLDFTRIENTQDAMEVIDFAREFVARQPPNSLHTLSDITDSRYDRDVTTGLQELAKHNKPYVIAGAAVGVSGLQKVVFRSILAFSGRKNIKLFDDRPSAMDWLATYAE
jgi:hypothetical protein